MQYDLEERTAVFGENIIDFIKTVERNEINRPLSNQIVRSATSIGANYMEANQASSKKDFTNKKPNKKSADKTADSLTRREGESNSIRC